MAGNRRRSPYVGMYGSHAALHLREALERVREAERQITAAGRKAAGRGDEYAVRILRQRWRAVSNVAKQLNALLKLPGFNL